jgi:hypothetical protein
MPSTNGEVPTLVGGLYLLAASAGGLQELTMCEVRSAHVNRREMSRSILGPTTDTASAARPRRRGDRIGRSLLRCISPLVAQSGHCDCAEPCPLLGVKRTSCRRDPQWCEHRSQPYETSEANLQTFLKARNNTTSQTVKTIESDLASR